MTADRLPSRFSKQIWKDYKIPENESENLSYFNLVRVSGNGNICYGFIVRGIGSLVIPIFSIYSRFNKSKLAELNQTLLEAKDKRFLGQEFCSKLGFRETSSYKKPRGKLIIGKYCIGPVTNWSEVGILIKLGKDLECKPAKLAKIVRSELSLKIEPIMPKKLENF